jgi:quinol monooxygenase YgiN
MNPGLTLIAILHGKPEKRDDLLATLREFVKPTRAEEGFTSATTIRTSSFFMRTGDRNQTLTFTSRRPS